MDSVLGSVSVGSGALRSVVLGVLPQVDRYVLGGMASLDAVLRLREAWLGAECPLEYVSIPAAGGGEGFCMALDLETARCPNITLANTNALQRLRLTADCDLKWPRKRFTNIRYPCPEGWDLRSDWCYLVDEVLVDAADNDSDSPSYRCNVMEAVPQEGRVLNAMQCNAQLIDDYGPEGEYVCVGTVCGLVDAQGDLVAAASPSPASPAEEFLALAQNWAHAELSAFLESGDWDDWLAKHGQYVSNQLAVCPVGYRTAGASLCVAAAGLPPIESCPLTFSHFDDLVLKYTLYSACGFSDDRVAPSTTTSSTPPSVVLSNASGLVPLNPVGPIDNESGEVYVGVDLADWQDPNLQEAEASPLSFFQTSLDVDDYGLRKKWSFSFRHKSHVKERLAAEKEDHFATERDVCRKDYRQPCPVMYEYSGSGVCMPAVLNAVRPPPKCPFKGFLPVEPPQYSKAELEILCEVQWPCAKCIVDYVGSKCPELYEYRTGVCLASPEALERGYPKVIDVEDWDALDRMEYAAYNRIEWPCFDSPFCQRDFSRPCPKHFEAISLVHDGTLTTFCLSTAFDDQRVCPSLVQSEDDPVFVELRRIHGEISEGKHIDVKDVTLWLAPQTLSDKLRVGSLCGVEWDCDTQCVPNYMNACPWGWRRMNDTSCVLKYPTLYNSCYLTEL